MKKVKVSIVVPVCNVEQYLKECLDSIINQTLREIEIICVNDGSKDNSLDILQEYERKDSRIIIINKPNAGYGHTMNIGFDRATGEYIGIVESDDAVKLTMYEKLYNCAVENNLDWVKSDFYRYTHNEDNSVNLQRINLCPNLNYYNKVFEPNYIVECYGFTMHTWCGIYKKDFIIQHNIRHNETPGASFQDTGFFFQTFAWAKRAMFINEAFYMYRCDNPASSVKSKTKVYCIRDEYDYVMDFFNRNKEIRDKVIKMIWVVRCGSYLRTYKRIAPEFKKDFLLHFSKVFNEAKIKGELDLKMFPKAYVNELEKIINAPERYYYFEKIKQQEKSGISINNFLLLFYRFKWCLADHGLIYTIKYSCSRLKKKLEPQPWTYRSALRAHLKIKGRQLLKILHCPNREMRKIQNLHNIHKGKRCFITCTGPSLLIEDLEKLENEFTIGVNTIFLAFNQTKWRPTYYAIVDAYIAEKYHQNYDMDFETFSKEDIFLNSYIKHKNSNKIHRCYIDFKNHTKKNLKNNQIYIDEDISAHIYDCFTVTNMAINIAIYMGFKDIYIIGADCNFDGDKIHFIPNQFDPRGNKKQRFKISVSRSISGYQALKQFAEKKEVNIYNATRGGHLEVFERVDFDDLFKEEAQKDMAFFEKLSNLSKGREILLWGGQKREFKKEFLNYFGYPLRNVFVTAAYTNGITVLSMSDISNCNNKFFILNLDDFQSDEKINILNKYGYSDDDFAFYKHKTLTVQNTNRYQDEYNNIVKNCPKNCIIQFNGENSSICFGKGCSVSGSLRIVVDSGVHIMFGDNVLIGGVIDCKDNSTLIIKERVEFRGTHKILIAKDGKIHISEKCYSGSGNDIRCHAGNSIYIGKDCMFSSQISIISGSGHQVFDVQSGKIVYDTTEMTNVQKSIYIGAHVWIGYGVTVLNGAVIEAGSIVGAKSLVKCKCPNNSMIVGNPCRIIKKNITWSRNSFEINMSNVPLEFAIITENNAKIKYIDNRR